MHISVTEESIQRANGLFWEQMLAMCVTPICAGEGSAEILRCIGSGHVLGACVLSGVWNGRVEVRLSRGLALEATVAMLMQPLEQVQESDTLDAVREIANMIAGTLKSALPRPCALSLPSAAIEPDDFCVLPRTQDSVTVFFAHQAGEFMVRVWEDGTAGACASYAKADRPGASLSPLAEAELEARAHAV
jgi:CheY-specific phosphatase CheX